MQKRIIYTDKNMRELNRTLDGRFPLRVEHERLSDFLHSTALFHWHPEVEFALVTDGSVICQINDTPCRLTAGDGIFFNTNVLHAYLPDEKNDCLYKAILFDPVLLGQPGSFIFEEMITPLLSNSNLTGLPLSSTVDWQRELLSIIKEIALLDLNRASFLQLRFLELLSRLWRILYENTMETVTDHSRSGKDIARMKQAMTYIQQSYGSLITLDDIADACTLSQSECCRLFRRILHQSPMEYVISCRIEKSLPLLADGRLPITEIAGMTGFQSSSYFAETFKKQTGMTPSAYRKQFL